MAMNQTFLTRAELDELNAQIIAGSEAARSRLVQAYYPYIDRTALQWARKLRVAPMHYDDLVATCRLAAWAAVQKFDPLISPSFKAMLPWCLKNSAEEYAGSTAYAVTMKGSLVSESRRVAAATNRLRVAGMTPTIDEIAAASKVRNHIVRHFSNPENFPSVSRSIDAPLSTNDGDTSTLADTLPSLDESAFDTLQHSNLQNVLGAAFATLSSREERIVRACVMGDGVNHSTLQSMSVEFGVTRERIRQLKIGALEKIRVYLREHNFEYEVLSVG